MAVRYITFEASTNCNMDCQFCFSDWREQDYAVSTETAKRTISALREQGLEGINFTGGEPLLRKDIPELICYSKDLGLTTILTTNGILLERKLGELADCLDFVGLPLDSSDPEVHNIMRPTRSVGDHYTLVHKLIEVMPRDYARIGVKINTVVTRQNKDSIISIGERIEEKTVAWKLSHFVASGYGKNFQEKFDIPIAEYLRLVERCRSAYPDMNIVDAVAHDCDEGCRVISPEGQLQMPTKSGLVNIGNLIALSRERLQHGLDEKMNLGILLRTYPQGGG